MDFQNDDYISNLLNIGKKEQDTYINYIANQTNSENIEENSVYKDILHSLTNEKSSGRDIDTVENSSWKKDISLNEQLYTYEEQTFSNEIYNQLTQQQKNFKTTSKEYSLLINGKDKFLGTYRLIDDENSDNIPYSTENKKRWRSVFFISFLPSYQTFESKKINIFENNPTIPGYNNNINLPNFTGFCWNGKFYKPFNICKPLGKIIDYYNKQESFYGTVDIPIRNNFKNIRSVEIVELQIPFYSKNIYQPDLDPTIFYEKLTNINSYPFIIVEIDNTDTGSMKGPIRGTNNYIDNCSVIVSHTDQKYPLNKIGLRNFITLKPITDTKIEFRPAPLANTNHWTISLRDPQGKILDLGKDGNKVTQYCVTNQIPERSMPYCSPCNPFEPGNTKKQITPGEILKYPDGDNFILKIQLEECFDRYEFMRGDTIVFKNFLPSVFPAGDDLFYYYTVMQYFKLFPDGNSLGADLKGCSIPFTLNPIFADKREKYYKDFDTPVLQNELIEFMNFLNRDEGHTILFTDYIPPGFIEPYKDTEKPNCESTVLLCDSSLSTSPVFFDSQAPKSDPTPTTDKRICNNCGKESCATLKNNSDLKASEPCAQGFEKLTNCNTYPGNYYPKRDSPDSNYSNLDNKQYLSAFNHNTIYIYGNISTDYKKNKIIANESYKKLINFPIPPGELWINFKKTCDLNKSKCCDGQTIGQNWPRPWYAGLDYFLSKKYWTKQIESDFPSQNYYSPLLMSNECDQWNTVNNNIFRIVSDIPRICKTIPKPTGTCKSPEQENCDENKKTLQFIPEVTEATSLKIIYSPPVSNLGITSVDSRLTYLSNITGTIVSPQQLWVYFWSFSLENTSITTSNSNFFINPINSLLDNLVKIYNGENDANIACSEVAVVFAEPPKTLGGQPPFLRSWWDEDISYGLNCSYGLKHIIDAIIHNIPLTYDKKYINTNGPASYYLFPQFFYFKIDKFIEKKGFAFTMNLNQQITLSLKITTENADASILYEKIKPIINTY